MTYYPNGYELRPQNVRYAVAAGSPQAVNVESYGYGGYDQYGYGDNSSYGNAQYALAVDRRQRYAYAAAPPSQVSYENQNGYYAYAQQQGYDDYDYAPRRQHARPNRALRRDPQLDGQIAYYFESKPPGRGGYSYLQYSQHGYPIDTDSNLEHAFPPPPPRFVQKIQSRRRTPQSAQPAQQSYTPRSVPSQYSYGAYQTYPQYQATPEYGAPADYSYGYANENVVAPYQNYGVQAEYAAPSAYNYAYANQNSYYNSPKAAQRYQNVAVQYQNVPADYGVYNYGSENVPYPDGRYAYQTQANDPYAYYVNPTKKSSKSKDANSAPAPVPAQSTTATPSVKQA